MQTYGYFCQFYYRLCSALFDLSIFRCDVYLQTNIQIMSDTPSQRLYVMCSGCLIMSGVNIFVSISGNMLNPFCQEYRNKLVLALCFYVKTLNALVT